jgi:NAD-dependent SIR2 family protein deacetylase
MDDFGRLTELVGRGGVVVLSGAGLSTESGIPDYRGPTGQARRAQPMTYQTFISSPAARQRYWARSFLGWRNVSAARPNSGHLAVTELQRQGLVGTVITQNVDGLHQEAGTSQVTELHGSLYKVRCLSCGLRSPRTELDERLEAANAAWAGHAGTVNPDGDVVLPDDEVAAFSVVDCITCGGVMKPDVVFFGENVPPERVAGCYEQVASARALLVLGSSLTVLSGFRFVRHAASLGIPVAIINQGATRGDALAAVTLDAPLGETLTALTAARPATVPR